MSSNKEYTSKVLQQVTQTLAEHHLLSPSDKVLIALSGGADSVALLLVLLRLHYTVEVLHCNFHLRGEESMRDENFVRRLCQKYDVRLFVKNFDTLPSPRQNKVSIATAARDLRYDWFERMLQEREASCIAVAHHQQDQAETLLLNLLRGSGIRGLSGMHYRRGNVIRPLLDVGKENITQFLRENQQEWVEDSTNKERDAQRNSIRLDVLPLLRQLNPKAIAHLAQTAKYIQQALPYYEKGVLMSSPDENTEDDGNGQGEGNGQGDGNSQGDGASKQGDDNNELLIPLDATILHEKLIGCGFTQSQERDIMSARTGALVTSTTHRLLRDRHSFILQSIAKLHPLPEVRIETCSKIKPEEMQVGSAYFDNHQVVHPLTIRLIRQGDRMIPFGMKGSRLVSDILTDRKLNLFQKERQQVVEDALGRILCIPGIRSSNLCRVTEHTDEVLIIRLVTSSG